MDLPTYTSIWRIEKRLYKLYDFRLPMPLPIGQVTVFAAIAVPYVVLLTMLGLPFNHTLIWLYLLPPGLATWLATRPVLESKRLPELIKSQLRYLAEPRVLCRMAPLSERDVVIVTGRVWRPRASRTAAAAAVAEVPVAEVTVAEGSPDRALSAPAEVPNPGALPAWVAGGPLMAADQSAGPPPAWARRPLPAALPERPARSEGPLAGWPPGWPAREQSARATVSARPADEMRRVAQGVPAPAAQAAAPTAQGSAPETAGSVEDAGSTDNAGRAPQRPAVTVVGAGAAQGAPPVVERALAGPSARRGDVRAGRVTVVPGGHRPGKPDLLQRDRTRAQMPIGDPARIVVLGCTVGAGQTITALVVGEVLASLRTDRVAVLDLNPGPGSLASRAETRPALSQAASLAPSRLAVLGPQRASGATQHRDAGQAAWRRDPAVDAMTFEAAASRYDLVLADPATAAVPRLLAVADHLVLVAPASAAAPGAIAMTFEWLEAHGQAGLAAGAIMVLNGVSKRSVSHVEQAERVCAGRCRAIVRVPWDDQLQSHSAKWTHPGAAGPQARQHWAGLLSPATAGAYTALAGVLVASLADRLAGSGREPQTAGLGQVRR